MESAYPPVAFYFKVVFEGTDQDTSFQEVSGISSQMETESYVEGGENRFTHKLPKGVTHSNLVLKRGIADANSPLVGWCQAVFEGGFSARITPKNLKVNLMNEDKQPIRSWFFASAVPVKWEVDTFNSTKNDVVIETIELSYPYSNRVA